MKSLREMDIKPRKLSPTSCSMGQNFHVEEDSTFQKCENNSNEAMSTQQLLLHRKTPTTQGSNSSIKLPKLEPFDGETEAGSTNGGQIMSYSSHRDLVQDSVKNGIAFDWKQKTKLKLSEEPQRKSEADHLPKVEEGVDAAECASDPANGSESNGHDCQDNLGDIKDGSIVVVGPREGCTPKALVLSGRLSQQGSMSLLSGLKDGTSIPAAEENSAMDNTVSQKQGAYYEHVLFSYNYNI